VGDSLQHLDRPCRCRADLDHGQERVGPEEGYALINEDLHRKS